jgi:hypothetical protein
MLALNANRIAEGLAAAEHALVLVERCGSPSVAAHALNTRGTLLILAGDERGITLLEQSLQLALAERLDEQVGRAYIHLAEMAQRHRRYDLADRHRATGSMASTCGRATSTSATRVSILTAAIGRRR